MIEMTYKPRSGQKFWGTGPLEVGVPVSFHWRTPASGIVNSGKNGNLFVVAAAADNNVPFSLRFQGVTIGEDTQDLSCQFGPNHGQFLMKPDTDYVGSVTAKYEGCAGVHLKLNAR